jgi:hypothetical protein
MFPPLLLWLPFADPSGYQAQQQGVIDGVEVVLDVGIHHPPSSNQGVFHGFHGLVGAPFGSKTVLGVLGPCQLNRTPLYSLGMAWHTCSMKAAPRVRSALSSSSGIIVWSCHEHLNLNQPV